MKFVSLGSIADIQLGKMLSPKSKTGASAYRYLRNQNVQWSRFDLSDLATMDFSEPERVKFELRPGDLLVCEGGEPGRCAVWQGEVSECYYQKALHRIRPHQDMADAFFLAYWLRHQALRGAFIDQNAKTTIAHLPLVRLVEFPVPDVSFDTQRAIARRLTAQLAQARVAHEAATAQQGLVEPLRQAALARVLAMAGPLTRLGDVAKVQSGYAFKSETFQRTGVRLLRNANMSPGAIHWSDTVRLAEDEASRHAAYALAAGDVLISLDRPVISSGVKVAKVSDADLPALLVQRVGRFLIDVRRLDPAYLYAFLRSPAFEAAITGHEQSLGVPHISPSQIEAIELPLPDLSRQQALARQLDELDTEVIRAKRAAEAQLREVEALPGRLLAQAFAEPAQG